MLEVLFKDAWRCPATTGGQVRRRPQDLVPIAFLKIRAFASEQATGNTFQTVDQARHGALRWIGNEQMNELGLAVHLRKLRLEVQANLLEDDLKSLESIAIKYFLSILCDKDQMDMQ